MRFIIPLLVVFFLGWVMYVSLKANEACKDAGYVKGEYMIPGGTICFEGTRLLSHVSGDSDG